MSANCNYLYTTDGSRWEGGTIQVTHLDARKTSERIGPDDLGKLRKEFGRKAVITVHCVTKNRESVTMKIDLARAKGRSGRREQKLDGTYRERLEVSSRGDQKAMTVILKEQLRTLPYGEKNAGAAIERMKVALDTLEHGTVARLIANFEAPHLLTMLARACAETGYVPPSPDRNGSVGTTGLSSLDALVIRTLLPMAQATLELEGIPLEPLERTLETIESTRVLVSNGWLRADGATSLGLADLLELCDDVDVLSLVASSPYRGPYYDAVDARIAERRFREVYFAKYGGPAPDPSKYGDIPDWVGAAGRRLRQQRQQES